MGFEDEVEQSLARPCRQTNGRSKRTCELTSAIVPRGTSFHRSVGLEFPPIAFDLVRFSCYCRGKFPGPSELSAVSPYAVQDHGQPTRQGHDRLFHPAAPGDLHRPGFEPGPFLRSQHALSCFVEHDPHHLISAADILPFRSTYWSRCCTVFMLLLWAVLGSSGTRCRQPICGA